MALNQGKLNESAKETKAAEKQVRQASSKTRESADVQANIDPADDKLNSRASDLALISPLGNPAKKDVIGKEGEEKHDVKPQIVGYRVKNVSDKAVDYLEFGLGSDANTNRLSHGENAVQKTIAPGAEADLTSYELALVLAQAEFNTFMNGGENKAFGVFTTPRQDEGGTENKTAANMKFHVKVKSGSIRELPYVNVLDAEWAIDSDTKKNRVVKRTLLPGFEKFGPLAETTRTRRAGTGKVSSAEPTRNQPAAQFLQAALRANKA